MGNYVKPTKLEEIIAVAITLIIIFGGEGGINSAFEGIEYAIFNSAFAQACNLKLSTLVKWSQFYDATNEGPYLST